VIYRRDADFFRSISMVVIAAVVGLAAVLAAFNWFEFGRID